MVPTRGIVRRTTRPSHRCRLLQTGLQLDFRDSPPGGEHGGLYPRGQAELAQDAGRGSDPPSRRSPVRGRSPCCCRRAMPCRMSSSGRQRKIAVTRAASGFHRRRCRGFISVDRPPRRGTPPPVCSVIPATRRCRPALRAPDRRCQSPPRWSGEVARPLRSAAARSSPSPLDGQHQHLGSAARLAKRRQRIDAVDARQVVVEQDHVGLQLLRKHGVAPGRRPPHRPRPSIGIG